MAIIKCKMCGGDLTLVEGQSVAECEYCGSRQTVPNADNERKLTLFARAHRLRAACEFDKAAGIYESIVADFPEEAEAYWGLVLCKYGIEYVDDPGTGKKIPTCHRSSFESVLDDPNFEQAQENADVLARKQNWEEAKQIEELRKGIIAVSSGEKPYDIFICYKETDAKGDRTLDSVLAQDIYDALTDRDYRVFFARESLELGQEYEPYIFAALNSAKIMLVVGTDREHFNAVWVKNEWSRYLKLMAADKSRHLIPCYKGMDAYDMPKEFAHLQAQDLGKIGADKDLLRGIEKYLPRKKTAMVQEQVVVSGSGDKVQALLDRGNMMLEDSDWHKADGFFEEVLNNDAKNARAYLGKALVIEQCVTLDDLTQKRIRKAEKIKPQTNAIPADDSHIREISDKYCKNGLLARKYIEDLYDFDLTYPSETADRERQYEAEQEYWAHDKWLSRAVQYAVEPLAEQLSVAKNAVLSAISNWTAASREKDAEREAQVRARYADHLAKCDVTAAQQAEVAKKKAAVQEKLNKEATTNPNAFHAWSKKDRPQQWKKYEEVREKRRKNEKEAGSIGTAIFFCINALSGILLLLGSVLGGGWQHSSLLQILLMAWIITVDVMIMFVVGKIGCISFVVILPIVGVIAGLLGDWVWILFAITSLLSSIFFIVEIQGVRAVRKLEDYRNEEFAVRSELVHSHRAYVSKLQKTYVGELGEYMVNQVIKQVVDAYPDEEFRGYLIEDIYPVIGYKLPEKEKK